MKEIPNVEVIYLYDEPSLEIGSSYQSDIFYSFRNLVTPHQAVFEFRNHKPVFRKDTGEELSLSYGDIVSVFGMSLQYLGKILIIWKKEGNLRIACRNRRI